MTCINLKQPKGQSWKSKTDNHPLIITVNTHTDTQTVRLHNMVITVFSLHISEGMRAEGCCSGFDFALCWNFFYFYVALKINND